MNQAEIDRESITYLINQSKSPEEARQRVDKLEGISLPRKYVDAIVEDTIKTKFLDIDSKAKAITAEINELEKNL